MAEARAAGQTAAPSAWIVVAGTAVAYAITGAFALILAGPPGYASPLYPSAGLALAACLVWGRRALPGVWLGSTAVNVGLGLLRGEPGLAGGLWLPLFIGLGAAAQAAAAAWMVKRAVGEPVVLNEPRHIASTGLLGGPLACLISASLAVPALWAAGVVETQTLLTSWGTWWLGDTMGTLIATPLALTVIGQPRADWRPRRRTLALPLLAAVALLALGVQQVRWLDVARQREAFEHDASQIANLVEHRLEELTHALQALHAAARVGGTLPNQTGLRQASSWWLEHTGALQAAGVGRRVAEADVEAFVAEARRSGEPGFRVFDQDGGADRRSRGELMVVRHLEPIERNRGAFGVNALSVAAARPAIEATRDTGEPQVSAAFRLSQSASAETGVVMYQALYRSDMPEPASAQQRREQWVGALFVTLRTELALAELGQPVRSRLSWCLLDADISAAVRQLVRVGSPAACDEHAGSPAAWHIERSIDWGGRRWTLRMLSMATVSSALSGEAGLLSGAGLMAAAMLGALLLVVTGHARRTELAVAAGTEKLRAEVVERRHAEAKQRDTRERLQGILDNAPLGVLFLDAQGHIIECNARWCEMTGAPAESLVGRSVFDRLHTDDRSAVLALRRDLLAGNAERSVSQLRLRGAAGDQAPWTPVRVIASALRDDAGRVQRVVAVVEDIADQLRLQESEQARARAESANRAKNEFLSRMSHELRTPLNAMLGFAQLLNLDREPPLAQHQQDWVQQVQRAGWHLLELINETLDLSRIESGSLLLKPQALDMRQMAESAKAMLAAAAAQRNVSVTIDVAGTVPAARADATRLRQVLSNLMSNAVKYNRPGGSVRVQIDHLKGPGAGSVRVAVSDTGLGMDAGQRARLFQPYDRLGREGSNIEGTGIGLVIAQRLLELMGGLLQVDSREGEGSTFSFTLPASPEAAAPRESVASQAGAAPYTRRLVHYVEDNITNIEVMRGVLAQRPQVRLEVSTLGLDGLAAIRREPPDLILLDMQLPDIAGPELLRFLKQDDALAGIPVIIVSADATPDQMRAALTMGALHYVTKPLDVSDFLARVDEALDGLDTRH